MTRFKWNPIAALSLASILAACAAIDVDTEAMQMRGTGAAQSRAYLHSYNLPASGLALDGYCAVSYFAAERPLLGKKEHTSTYEGVDYRFSSADAKRMFDRNPQKYLPAFGGWCAFGMAIQDKFPIDPLRYKIVDGRLFLFLRNEKLDALALWNKSDEQPQVAKANAHWKKVSK